MSDKEQYLITCRFPEWYQGTHKFKAFGVKYLITTPILGAPDWDENDERWLKYNFDQPIIDNFKEQYKAMAKKDFDGEILFIEASDLVVLGGR